MAVNVTFYKNASDPAALDKTITQIGETSVAVTVKGNCGILNPVLVLSYSAAIAEANYCYIDAPYSRYYHLSAPTLSPGKRMTFTGKVDPLMSFNSAIKDLNVYVARCEMRSEIARYIADGLRPTAINPSVLTKAFSINPFSTGDTGRHYVLTVTGGHKNDT